MTSVISLFRLQLARLLGETERMMPLGIKFQLQCIDSRFYSILLHLCFMSFKMATISA